MQYPEAHPVLPAGTAGTAAIYPLVQYPEADPVLPAGTAGAAPPLLDTRHTRHLHILTHTRHHLPNTQASLY